MSKFDKYIFTIPKEYHNWDGYASPRGGFSGYSDMPGSKLNMGFSVATKANVMEVPHMHHGVEEYLFFTGTDLVNFFDFDAEIEVWMGDDPDHMEMVTITAPTIIRIPPNLWHCPINFKRVGKPVNFSPFYLDGDWSKITRRKASDGKDEYIYEGSNLRQCVLDKTKKCVFCGKCFSQAAKEMTDKQPDTDPLAPYYEMAKQPRTGAFDKYVYTIEKEYHQWGETFANPRGGYAGCHIMEGTKLYTGFDVMLKECPMDEPHIHHAVEEYLFFTGADLLNFFDFDAEIEFYLGDDPDHMEKFVITQPTIVRIPPNLWHCPINFARIGKPVNFMPIYLDGVWSKITRRYFGGDKRPTYVYEAVDLQRCRYDSEKICNYCGKCYSETMQTLTGDDKKWAPK